MNSTIKGLLIFVAGVCAGGAGAYFYTKNQYENKVNNEIESMRLYFEQKVDAKANDMAKQIIADENKKENESEEKPNKTLNVPVIEADKRTNYNLISEHYGVDSEGEEIMEKKAEQQYPKDQYPVPYAIDSEEFMNNEDFDKVTVTYYVGDGQLYDDASMELMDIHTTLGEDAKTIIKGSLDSLQNECYIRNERINIDYEVIIDQGTYSYEVLGRKPEDLYDE